MLSFLRETKAYKMVNFDTKQHSSSWTISAVSLAASIIVIFIIICWVLRKGKCFLNHIIGKRETTKYDLKGVNVKQALTNGKQVKMSVLQEEGSINHAFEGQRNTFR